MIRPMIIVAFTFRRSNFCFRLLFQRIKAYNPYGCNYNLDGVKQHWLHTFVWMSGVGSYLLQSLHSLHLPLEPQVQPAKLQIHGRHVQRVGRVVHTGGATAHDEDNATEDTMCKRWPIIPPGVSVISHYKPFWKCAFSDSGPRCT